MLRGPESRLSSAEILAHIGAVLLGKEVQSQKDAKIPEETSPEKSQKGDAPREESQPETGK